MPKADRARTVRTVLLLLAVALAGMSVIAAPGPAGAAPAARHVELRSPLRHPVLHLGSRGYPVRWVQWRLQLRGTGHYDRRTQQAVRRFQRRHHLHATGRVGRWTWRALLPPRPATAARVPPAPSGQVTVTGLLPPAAASFPGRVTGWTPVGAAVVGQTPAVGHDTAGALSVVSRGAWTGAASPQFPVVPGDRYVATASVMAQSAARRVVLALRFRDAGGAVLAAGTALGQVLLDRTSTWSATLPVVGFAPAGAVAGEVLFLDYDGAADDGHWLDDVSVSSTSGTAAGLRAPLRTSGPNILDALGRRVSFAGVDIDGLQYSASAQVGTNEIDAARRWGANLVRIPLGEDYALPGDCLYDAAYLDRVDSLVRSATGRGMFALLDLHTLSIVPCAAPRQQPMPDDRALRFWRIVADRYRNDPLVGFDLYNEPHDVTDAVWHGGGTVSSGGVSYPAPGMQTLYDAIRATGVTNLVFVSGTAWSTQFPTSAPLSRTTNLVYAPHAYTCPTSTAPSTCRPGPGGVYDPSGILANFTSVAARTPVVVTEFGWPDRDDGRYLANVIAYAGAHGMSGWDVYAFDGTTSGTFDLLKDVGPLLDPAPSGMAVVAGMRND